VFLPELRDAIGWGGGGTALPASIVTGSQPFKLKPGSVRQQNDLGFSMIPKSGYRFSEKIMLH
jgi:hypothetical protein